MIASLELVKILEQKFSRQEAERIVTLLDTQSSEQMKQVYMTKDDKVELTDRINAVSINLNERIGAVSVDLNERINEVSVDLIERINVVSNNLTEKINSVSVDLTEKINLISINLTERIMEVSAKVDNKSDSLENKMLLKMEANFRWLVAVMITGIATTATIVKLIS